MRSEMQGRIKWKELFTVAFIVALVSLFTTPAGNSLFSAKQVNIGIGTAVAQAADRLGPPTPEPKPPKGRRVIRARAMRDCRDMERKRTVFVDAFNVGVRFVPLRVRNGNCKNARIKTSTCEYGMWTSQNEPDPSLQNNWYYHCQVEVVWQTTRYTWYGLCWAQLGMPQDSNAIITATYFIETGYDNRGALRTISESPDPNRDCRVS